MWWPYEISRTTTPTDSRPLTPAEVQLQYSIGIGDYSVSAIRSGEETHAPLRSIQMLVPSHSIAEFDQDEALKV